MSQKSFDDETLDELADKSRDKEVAKTLDDLKKKYKVLFGNDPDDQLTILTIADIQEKIRTRMPRPYKL